MRLLLPVVLGAFIVLGLSAFSIFQHGTIENQKEQLVDSGKKIKYLSDNLLHEDKNKKSLLDDNINLEDRLFEAQDKIVVLRDSIRILKFEISRLRKKIRTQADEITALQETIKTAQASYQEIKQEITGLSTSDQVDRDRIAVLEQEKAELRSKIKMMEQEKIKIALAKVEYEEKKEKTEAQMMDIEVYKEKFQRLADILNNTKVRFESISFRKKRYSADMQRLKKKSWRYTIMNFYLEHEDLKLLIDEKFVLKIIDMDTNLILSYVESNPNFPDNQLKIDGLQFKFDGNMIEIVHFNNEKKESKNYELQLYYIDEDGEETMLMDGAKQIVEDGKPAI